MNLVEDLWQYISQYFHVLSLLSLISSIPRISLFKLFWIRKFFRIWQKNFEYLFWFIVEGKSEVYHLNITQPSLSQISPYQYQQTGRENRKTIQHTWTCDPWKASFLKKIAYDIWLLMFSSFSDGTGFFKFWRIGK